jgi:hypothetical protein
VRDSFTLHIKMSWSKNIRTEMQSPTQILLAAIDPIICPLLNLSVFIETFGGHGGLMFDRAKKTTTNLIDEILASQNELVKKHSHGDAVANANFTCSH